MYKVNVATPVLPTGISVPDVKVIELVVWVVLVIVVLTKGSKYPGKGTDHAYSPC